MTDTEIFEALMAILDGDLEELIFKLEVPERHLHKTSKVDRVKDVIQHLKSRGRLGELVAMLRARKVVVPHATEAAGGQVPASQDAAGERERIRRSLFGYHVEDPQSLECDRYDQWGEVQLLAKTSRSEVILVPGANRQGHEYFLLRIETGLPRDEPPRRDVWVSWRRRPFPIARKDFLDALGEALRVAPDNLVPALGAAAAHGNLFLLHQVVRGELDAAQPLIDYYTEWLPDLIARARPACGVKVVQPIAWATAGTLARLVAPVWEVFGRPDWVRRATQARDAHALVAAIAGRAREVLPVVRMHDLTGIRREHVERFAVLARVPAARRARFVDLIMSGELDSEGILQAIVEYLPGYRDPEATGGRDGN